jgi:hypothetical protein
MANTLFCNLSIFHILQISDVLYRLGTISIATIEQHVLDTNAGRQLSYAAQMSK